MTRHQSNTDRALAAGRRAFGGTWSPHRLVRAPGRLELIGNHVDYNGGLVLAGAVEQHVVVAISSGGAPDTVTFLASDLSNEPLAIQVADCGDWTNSSGVTGPEEYTRGVVASLLARNRPVREGLLLAIAGDVPLGFGMSSSAALCVSLVLALSDQDLPAQDIVAIAREAEHRSGSPVGAMDQSASVAGGVILFDGRDSGFTAMAPELGEHVFLVADSGVSHAIGQSSYPIRVQESQAALAELQGLGLNALPSLGELDPDTWSAIRVKFLAAAGSTLADRVDHVVSEVERVRQGLAAVETADWSTFGQLMTASGRSSSTAYEISHPAVDELVALMLTIDGVLGARMMGGGEGGPALALAHRDAIPDIRNRLDSDYFNRHPSHLDGDRLLVAAFGPGARVDPA